MMKMKAMRKLITLVKEEEEDDNDSESPEEDDEDESVVKERAKLERRMGALDMKKFFAGNLFSASLKEQVYIKNHTFV